MNHKPIIIEKSDDTHNLFDMDMSIFEGILKQNNSHIKVTSIEHHPLVRDKYYGGRGEKAIVNVEYSEAKVMKEASFFVKEHCNDYPSEALNYINLGKCNAPIPILYAYFSEPRQHDIIIVEMLKPYLINDDPIFMLDEVIFSPFIEVTAMFNSTKIENDYKKMLIEGYDLFSDKIVPFKTKLITMFKTIKRNPTYNLLMPLLSNDMENKIIATHLDICKKISKMEKGLYHWDHTPRNFGWSDTQQKHVIFDIEDTLWAPRFYNIGMWLGGDDSIEPKYQSREKLARKYLDIYNPRCDKNISTDTLLKESRPIWLSYKIEQLLTAFHESGPQPYFGKGINPIDYRKKVASAFASLVNIIYNN